MVQIMNEDKGPIQRLFVFLLTDKVIVRSNRPVSHVYALFKPMPSNG